MQREAVIAMLAHRHAPESVAVLHDYVVGWDDALWDKSISESDNHDGAVELERLREGVASDNDISSLHNIHPEWMLQILERESPRIIAILLRYIPSHHVQYILDRLSPHVKERMPHFVDAFSVPTPVVRAIRRRFESHFDGVLAKQTVTSEFSSVVALKYDDLPKFFRDLGLHEIALAFSDADPLSIQVLMKRLPESDARRLEERMHQVVDAPKTLTRDAKFTILDINVESLPAERFLFEVGLRAFAKACDRTEQDVIRALSLKLEPKVGEWLLSQSARKAGGGELGGMRRQMILSRLETLFRAGVLAS